MVVTLYFTSSHVTVETLHHSLICNPQTTQLCHIWTVCAAAVYIDYCTCMTEFKFSHTYMLWLEIFEKPTSPNIFTQTDSFVSFHFRFCLENISYNVSSRLYIIDKRLRHREREIVSIFGFHENGLCDFDTRKSTILISHRLATFTVIYVNFAPFHFGTENPWNLGLELSQSETIFTSDICFSYRIAPSYFWQPLNLAFYHPFRSHYSESEHCIASIVGTRKVTLERLGADGKECYLTAGLVVFPGRGLLFLRLVDGIQIGNLK